MKIIPKYISEMKILIDKKDFVNLRNIAHTLNGACMTVNIDNLYNYSNALYKMAMALPKNIY